MIRNFVALFVVVSIVFCGRGCKNDLATQEPMEQEASAIGITKYDVSASDVIDFLDSNNEVRAYSRINISRHFTATEEIFFVELTEHASWWTELYIIDFKDGVIIALTDTQIGGFERFFSYEIVEISNKPYIAAFCATHMGNGNLEIVPMGHDAQRFSIPCIDNHFEETSKTAVDNGIFEDGATASSVFLGGKLDATFADYNNDGCTDIVLVGIEHIYIESNDASSELIGEYFIKQIYIYDAANDELVLSDSIRQSIST